MMGKSKRTGPGSRMENEIQKAGIETELDLGITTLKGGTADTEDTFHNTKMLLKQYRRVEYAVKVSEEELGLRSEADIGIHLSALEINAELAGIDLSGTRLEGYTRSVVRSRRILEVIQNALEHVREDPDRGEELYQVLHQTYFTPRKPQSRDEILRALSTAGFAMSRSKYHIMLNEAIKAIDRILWGYTTRECMEFVRNLQPD